ncbi:MAG: HPr family phosphocarrier protein [Rubrobacter sp.]|nr:HPr family phosphocarrier protein [Rubrobacter sp.]
MVEKEATIGPSEGLHARPAAIFVKESKRYAAEIKVIKDGREVNAKSSLQILTVGAKKGESITIRAEGEDAERAVEALAELISREEPPDES